MECGLSIKSYNDIVEGDLIETFEQIEVAKTLEAEAAKLEAEGEAEYMRMLAEAYDNKDKQEFYEFTLALDALKESLNGDQKTVILDGNSELAKILMGDN